MCGCTDGIIRYENAMTTVYIVEVLLTDTLVCRQLYLWMPLQNPRCFSQLPYKLCITSSYGHLSCILRVSARENFHCIKFIQWKLTYKFKSHLLHCYCLVWCHEFFNRRKANAVWEISFIRQYLLLSNSKGEDILWNFGNYLLSVHTVCFTL